MDPDNRWVKLSEIIPWNELEISYVAHFESNTGNVAKPLRRALGSLILQRKYGFSDVEVLEQITKNPYYQFSLGYRDIKAKLPLKQVR